MKNDTFEIRLAKLKADYKSLVERPNQIDESWFNGLYERYRHPVVTAAHHPIEWRYDLNPETNPHLIERLGINAVMNAGAMEWGGKIIMVTRSEGYDRKSFFAVCESESGVDRFSFWEKPLVIPTLGETNTYDMRLVQHEDGWIYGLFCAEYHDDSKPSDPSAALAQAGIVRTKDMMQWERLPNLKSNSSQQRNVVLHPELHRGKYLFYTRPQDGFIDTGSGGGISWGLSETMENPEVQEEILLDPRVYHTIKEVKNGMGAAPIKTVKGWLHIDHGVRNTAAGLRYVLYAFLCDLEDPTKVIARPGGHLIAPLGEERVGDVSNVVFSNGVVARENGDMYIYYASCDTRMHVATTTVEKMLDYVYHTPEDALTSYDCVQQRIALIEQNKAFL